MHSANKLAFYFGKKVFYFYKMKELNLLYNNNRNVIPSYVEWLDFKEKPCDGQTPQNKTYRGVGLPLWSLITSCEASLPLRGNLNLLQQFYIKKMFHKIGP